MSVTSRPEIGVKLPRPNQNVKWADYIDSEVEYTPYTQRHRARSFGLDSMNKEHGNIASQGFAAMTPPNASPKSIEKTWDFTPTGRNVTVDKFQSAQDEKCMMDFLRNFSSPRKSSAHSTDSSKKDTSDESTEIAMLDLVEEDPELLNHNASPLSLSLNLDMPPKTPKNFCGINTPMHFPADKLPLDLLRELPTPDASRAYEDVKSSMAIPFESRNYDDVKTPMNYDDVKTPMNFLDVKTPMHFDDVNFELLRTQRFGFNHSFGLDQEDEMPRDHYYDSNNCEKPFLSHDYGGSYPYEMRGMDYGSYDAHMHNKSMQGWSPELSKLDLNELSKNVVWIKNFLSVKAQRPDMAPHNNMMHYPPVPGQPVPPSTPYPYTYSNPLVPPPGSMQPPPPPPVQRRLVKTSNGVVTLPSKCSVAPPRKKENRRRKSSKSCRAPKLTCRYFVPDIIAADSTFRVTSYLIGKGGQNMKSISEATQAKLRVRGKYSGHLEGPKMLESEDPLQLCISAPSLEMYEKAKRLVSDLFVKMFEEYSKINPRFPKNYQVSFSEP